MQATGNVSEHRRMSDRTARLFWLIVVATVSVFASLLPKARFAPVIPGWEEIAQITSNAIQKIYLGQGEIEATLKDTATQANAILAKK